MQNKYVFLFEYHWPSCTNASVPIIAISHPESSTPFFLVGPVSRRGDRLLDFQTRAIESLQAKHLDKSCRSSDTHPGPGKVHHLELVGSNQRPGLRMADSNKALAVALHLIYLGIFSSPLVEYLGMAIVFIGDRANESPYRISETYCWAHVGSQVEGCQVSIFVDHGDWLVNGIKIYSMSSSYQPLFHCSGALPILTTLPPCLVMAVLPPALDPLLPKVSLFLARWDRWMSPLSSAWDVLLPKSCLWLRQIRSSYRGLPWCLLSLQANIPFGLLKAVYGPKAVFAGPSCPPGLAPTVNLWKRTSSA